MPVTLSNGVMTFAPTDDDEVGTYTYELDYQYYFDEVNVYSYTHPHLLSFEVLDNLEYAKEMLNDEFSTIMNLVEGFEVEITLPVANYVE